MRTKTPQQAEKMLEAAGRLFGDQRFHEVRMEDIAAEASVGKGTLYRYFSDKEDLFLALLSRASTQFQECIRSALDRQTDYREKLVAFVEAGVQFFDDRPHLGAIIQRAEVTRGSESPWRPARDKVYEWIVEVFHEAAAADAFTVRHPEVSAYMLLGGLRSVVLFGPQPRDEDLPAIIVDDFLHGASR